MTNRFRLIIPIAAAAVFTLSSSIMSAEIASDAAGSSPWGPQDEIGSLNMMTEESRAAILSRVKGGRVFDLGVEYFVGMPDCCSAAFGDPTYQHMMTHVPSRDGAGEMVSHTSEAISMNTHTGTHIDTLNHFGLHGTIWNGHEAEAELGARGWSRSGAEKYPPIVARGVLIDVAGAKGLDILPPSYSITVQDLQTALMTQGTEIEPGDVVLIRTGQMTAWPDRASFNLFQQSGLGIEAAQWLVESQNVMLLGADNLGLENFPSPRQDNFAPVHTYLLAEKGVSFIEMIWLEDLAEAGIYEFAFLTAPLKLRGASGSPLRPMALPID
ncbi:MAG: cyclase family protein [Rhizobiaceae bacterium]|nr:cyclase family protein [Rhizobiaceae bacterium]